MNIQRFTGATSREALAKARLAFGEGTLILSNRPTALGVEVMATAEDDLSGLEQRERGASQPKTGAVQRQVPVLTTMASPAAQQQVEDEFLTLNETEKTMRVVMTRLELDFMRRFTGMSA